LEIKILNNWNKEHQTILNKINNFAEMPDEIQVQKNKFALLSELLLKLCTTQDIRSNFKNLTSLIILFLNVYKKNYPVDIYSKGSKKNHLGELDDVKFKSLLKQESLAGK
jgi:hypothetical protein